MEIPLLWIFFIPVIIISKENYHIINTFSKYLLYLVSLLINYLVNNISQYFSFQWVYYVGECYSIAFVQ